MNALAEDSDLPEGWTEAALQDLASKRLGKMLDAGKQNKGVPLPYLRNINVRWHEVDLSDLLTMTFTEDEQREFELLQGDVLVCEGGEPGRAAIWRNGRSDIKFQKALHRIRVNEGLDSRWLVYHLQHDALKGTLEEYFTGSTIKHFTGISIAKYRLKLPPLAEQKRVVAKVETLLARVNAARQRLAKVPALLKRFRQSVLAAACSGQLTEDWRLQNPDAEPQTAAEEEGKFDLPQRWKWVRFNELMIALRSGSNVPPQNEPTAFPVLRSSSVRPGFVDLQDVRFLNSDESENEDNYLNEGDLLFTRLSGSLEFVGNCARVPKLNGMRIQYPDRLFRAKLKDPEQGLYFVCVFAAPFIREHLTEGAKSSAGHQRISMGNITNQLVPLPPLAEQHEIVRRVEALLARADRIEKRLATATRRVETLTQAILAQAFRGELVPTEAELARREGRDYEPAAVLLERIRAKSAADRTPVVKQRGKRQAN